MRLILLLACLVPLLAQAPRVIKPGDKLSIEIGSGCDLGPTVVRDDGRIPVSLIGEIDAAGRTADELKAAIAWRLERISKNAAVTVAFDDPECAACYFLQGEVVKPGRYQLIAPTRVLGALVRACGFREHAQLTDIVILRADGGETRRLPFNYSEVSQSRNLAQNIMLKPGDIIVVR